MKYIKDPANLLLKRETRKKMIFGSENIFSNIANSGRKEP